MEKEDGEGGWGRRWGRKEEIKREGRKEKGGEIRIKVRCSYKNEHGDED